MQSASLSCVLHFIKLIISRTTDVSTRLVSELIHYAVDQSWSISLIAMRSSGRGEEIPGTRSPWQLNFVQWRLIFVGPRYETFFMSPSWRLEFWDGSSIFGKFVHFQTGPEAHPPPLRRLPALFRRRKAAGTWRWPPTPDLATRLEKW
jgi:hypothetical protein